MQTLLQLTVTGTGEEVKEVEQVFFSPQLLSFIFVGFYFILFYFILFYFILFYFTLLYFLFYF